jgi:acid phosphatase
MVYRLVIGGKGKLMGKFSRTLAFRLFALGCILGVTVAIIVWLKSVPHARVGSLYLSYPANASMRFFMIGDSGFGGEGQKRVADVMESRCLAGDLDGIILLGNNFHPKGVQSLVDEQWETKLLSYYSGECLGQAPIFPILGSLDYRGTPNMQVVMTEKLSRWKMPHRYYQVEFGDLVRFVAFDSNSADYCFFESFCSLDFLLAALKAPGPKWKIVMSHHPLTSSRQGWFRYFESVIGYFISPLVCEEADVWVAGRDNLLEHRSLPECGTDFLISGGGGAPLKEFSGGDEKSHFVSDSLGFLEVEINTKEIKYQFWDDSARLIYSGGRR